MSASDRRGVGVTVGSVVGDRYRDREVIREREYRDRDETVVIKRKPTAITILTARSSSSANVINQR